MKYIKKTYKKEIKAIVEDIGEKSISLVLVTETSAIPYAFVIKEACRKKYGTAPVFLRVDVSRFKYVFDPYRPRCSSIKEAEQDYVYGKAVIQEMERLSRKIQIMGIGNTSPDVCTFFDEAQVDHLTGRTCRAILRHFFGKARLGYSIGTDNRSRDILADGVFITKRNNDWQPVRVQGEQRKKALFAIRELKEWGKIIMEEED